MKPALLLGVVDSGEEQRPADHGAQVVRLIRERAGDVRILYAQAFSESRGTPAQLAAAIDGLVDEGVALINLSLGLRRAAAALRLACERAADAGVVLVASSPARGAPVYPAAYPQCIAVCGDARCGPEEISDLAGSNADLGAHPFALDHDAGSGGASFACARVSARLALLLAQGTAPAAALQTMRAQARYRAPERRSA